MMERRKKGQEMQTIREQIKKIIIVMQATTLALIGVISCSLNLVTMQRTLEQTMFQTAHVAANQVMY